MKKTLIAIALFAAFGVANATPPAANTSTSTSATGSTSSFAAAGGVGNNVGGSYQSSSTSAFAGATAGAVQTGSWLAGGAATNAAVVGGSTSNSIGFVFGSGVGATAAQSSYSADASAQARNYGWQSQATSNAGTEGGSFTANIGNGIAVQGVTSHAENTSVAGNLFGFKTGTTSGDAGTLSGGFAFGAVGSNGALAGSGGTFNQNFGH